MYKSEEKNAIRIELDKICRQYSEESQDRYRNSIYTIELHKIFGLDGIDIKTKNAEKEAKEAYEKDKNFFPKERMEEVKEAARKDAKKEARELSASRTFVKLFDDGRKYHLWDEENYEMIFSSNSASKTYEKLKSLSDDYLNNPENKDLKSDMKTNGAHNASRYGVKHGWTVDELKEGKRNLCARIDSVADIYDENYDVKTNQINKIDKKEVWEGIYGNFAEDIQKENPQYKGKVIKGYVAYDPSKSNNTIYQVYDTTNRKVEKYGCSALEAYKKTKDDSEIARTSQRDNDGFIRANWNIFAYPKKDIKEIGTHGEIKLKEDSPLVKNKSAAKCGEINYKEFYSPDEEEEELGIHFICKKDYSPKFIQKVKEEAPEMKEKISEHSQTLFDVYNRPFSLDSLASAGLAMAEEKEAQQDKSRSRTQTER